MYICIYICIYICAGELVSVPAFCLSRPPQELETVPPLGGPFSHYKNSFFEDLCVAFWCQFVFFFCFWLCLNYSPLSSLSSLLLDFYPLKKSPFFRKCKNGSKNTTKTGVFEGYLFFQQLKNLVQKLQICVSQTVHFFETITVFIARKPLYFCTNLVFENARFCARSSLSQIGPQWCTRKTRKL